MKPENAITVCEKTLKQTRRLHSLRFFFGPVIYVKEMEQNAHEEAGHEER
jgi:hypothetical protein